MKSREATFALRNHGAQFFVPDGSPARKALARTTHLGIGAHADDIPIMAYPGILECFQEDKEWFLGVTVTNGSGSPRNGLYAAFSDKEMQAVRAEEEKKAACVGRYSAAILLNYSSAAVKNPSNSDLKEDLKAVIESARPEVIYTHNLADKHDTHVAVALRTLQAIRELPPKMHPKAVYGCEVWRDLDWMTDKDKVAFDVSAHENLGLALVGVYDSQICGGKRYDLATAGRRRAHATYHESHKVDDAQSMVFCMNLTPLISKRSLDMHRFVQHHIERFAADVAARIQKFV